MASSPNGLKRRRSWSLPSTVVPDAKYQSVQAFRARFQEEGYERYVFIGEAWKGSAGSKLRPSESDSRQEVVIIMAGDVDGRSS